MSDRPAGTRATATGATGMRQAMKRLRLTHGGEEKS
jgi:hypothetical protein